MSVRLVLVAGVCALLLAVMVVLAQSAPHRSGTNGIPAETFAVVLQPGEAVCQEGELVPGDTAAIRATVGSFYRPTPPLMVTADRGGAKPLTVGELAAGWRQGVVAVPVREVRTTVPGVRVCMRDAGRVRITIGGAAPYHQSVTEIVGPRGGTLSVAAGIRFDYMRRGSASWFSLLPTLWYRMTLAKGGLVRHFAPWAALILMMLAGGLAARVLVREGTP